MRYSIDLPDNLNPDSALLIAFVGKKMGQKMLQNQEKYGFTNEWKTDEWESKCREDLVNHLAKGDPIDVLIYCAFLSYRLWRTTPIEAPTLLELIPKFQQAINDYQESAKSRDQVVREIDVIINGEAGAAKQASLVDLVGQIHDLVKIRGKRLELRKCVIDLLYATNPLIEHDQRVLDKARAAGLAAIKP